MLVETNSVVVASRVAASVVEVNKVEESPVVLEASEETVVAELSTDVAAKEVSIVAEVSVESEFVAVREASVAAVLEVPKLELVTRVIGLQGPALTWPQRAKAATAAEYLSNIIFTKNKLTNGRASKRKIEERVDGDSIKHSRDSAVFNTPL